MQSTAYYNWYSAKNKYIIRQQGAQYEIWVNQSKRTYRLLETYGNLEAAKTKAEEVENASST